MDYENGLQVVFDGPKELSAAHRAQLTDVINQYWDLHLQHGFTHEEIRALFEEQLLSQMSEEDRKTIRVEPA